MTTFRDCIINTIKAAAEKGDKSLAGRRQKKLDETLGRYDDLEAELKAKGIANADEIASKEILDSILMENAAKRRREYRQVQAMTRIEGDIKGYQGEATDALIALWEYDNRATYSNVMARHATLRGRFHAMFSKNLEKYGTKFAGFVRPKAGLDNIVRESFGEKTADASAVELYKEWANVAEFTRRAANRAGANIAERKTWRLPQKQSRVAVTKAGEEVWVADHMRTLNWDNMRHPDTGLPIKPGDRIPVLKQVWATLKTDGMIKANTAASYRRSHAGRLEHSRFFEYKDADSWLKMHEKYGDGSVFDVMIGHLDHMARTIAQLEILGPNPYAAKEQAKIIARKAAAQADVAIKGASKKATKTSKIEDKLKKFDELYEIFNGSNSASRENFWANTMAGTRNLLVSMYLGGTSLVAIPGDLFTTAMTRLFNKHPGAASITQYLKLMNPLDSGDRKLATRLGLIAENATALAYGQQRFFDTVMGPQITRRISDVVLRLSLLSPHTQMSKWSFGMEALGMFADHAGKTFDELPFKGSLSNHGITASDWDILRKTPFYQERGATFLRPDDLLVRVDLAEDVRTNVANKFMDYIHMESQFAVPTASLRARAALTGVTRPGTLIGEIARSFAMFKNFPITILLTHISRGMNISTAAGKLSYLASFGIGMTMMGALSTQLRQIRDGKDPLTMNPKTPEGLKFWASASLTGGGMGIWGDFLFNNLNRFGGGPTETAAGPVVGIFGDITNLTIGNAVEAIQGKETKVGPETVQFLRNHHPGGSLWYGKLVMQRLIWDKLLEEVDPEAHRKFRNQERAAQRDFGQDFWWRPGENKPQRAPKLNEVIK